MNPLKKLTTLGQSVWLDYIKRSFVVGGELRKLIAEDGLTGVTSNPAIFEEAITQGDEYDAAIRRAAENQESAEETYAKIAIADVQLAADDLREVYTQTDGRDGFVSLEVSPHLAYDTEGSITQARELWSRVNRPNLFIKIPGTKEGLPAIRRLLAEGININITLLFGLTRYRAVAEACFGGLEDRRAAGKPLERVASVASFFLSRIDLAVDPMLERLARENREMAAAAERIRGQVAIASAKQAYQIFKELHGSDRFRELAAAGARPQRLLWASTGTKKPEERDVRYVEALIGPETINTLPRKTLEAFRHHGEVAALLDQDLNHARAVLRELGELGISLEAVSRQLEEEGVQKFIKPFDHLHAELQRKLGAAAARGERTRA
jgi:transaldolase